MKARSFLTMAGYGVLVAAGMTTPADAAVSLSWADPWWVYEFEADNAAGAGTTDQLDGHWTRVTGSDSWDGSAIGGTFSDVNHPGGVSALKEGATGFLRLQDPGDPRDHAGFGFSTSDPTDRRIRFGYDLQAEGVPSNIMDAGMTLTFRARLATAATGPVDGQFADSEGEGAGTPGGTPWPAGGTGGTLHDNGRGMITLRQNGGSARVISFCLALPSDHGVQGLGAGLLTNPRGSTVNLVPIADLTKWHEFWVAIAADISGGGTHRVEVYVDGSLSPSVLHVTATNAAAETGTAGTSIALGPGATPQMCAFDVDFLAWRGNAIPPLPLPPCPDPFADHDKDNDVDQEDFAAWQRCYTGPGRAIADRNVCRCFDTGGDNSIDDHDLQRFIDCASGAGVPADTACDDL